MHLTNKMTDGCETKYSNVNSSQMVFQMGKVMIHRMTEFSVVMGQSIARRRDKPGD